MEPHPKLKLLLRKSLPTMDPILKGKLLARFRSSKNPPDTFIQAFVNGLLSNVASHVDEAKKFNKK